MAGLRSWRRQILVGGVISTAIGTAVAMSCLDHAALPSLGGAREGDVVLVRGRTFRSAVMHLVESDLHSYTHVAIVRFVNDTCTAIHADPSRHLVVQESCESFVSPARVSAAAIYRLVAPDDRSLAAHAAVAAQGYHDASVRFDDRFDLTTANTLYCTELVWRAYLAAGVDLTDSSFAGRKYLFPSDLVKSGRISYQAPQLW